MPALLAPGESTTTRYPSHLMTGWGGYFANRGSDFDCVQSKKREPFGDTTSLITEQVSHRLSDVEPIRVFVTAFAAST